jgi:hypothetical protein
MKIKLHDEFNNNEINHFSNYDYILQLNTNGQFSPYKEFLKELDNNSLLILAIHHGGELKDIFYKELKNEILKRMEK